jgi:hypothetical protein
MHRSKSRKTRARVEHMFGAQVTAPGNGIGIVQARAKIGLQPHEDGVRSNVSGNGRHAKRKALICHLMRCEHIGVNRGLKCRRQDNVARGELQRLGE